MTDWRVGWLITTPEHAAAAGRHVAATITHVPGINQAAATTALTDTNTPRQPPAGSGATGSSQR